MLFLKVQSLAYGYSGVQLQTVERLVDMFNQRVLPGSLRWVRWERQATRTTGTFIVALNRAR